MTDRMNPTDQATPLTQELDAAWRELEADALASDGPIRDRDVRDAIKRNRARIEAAAIATIDPRVIAIGQAWVAAEEACGTAGVEGPYIGPRDQRDDFEAEAFAPNHAATRRVAPSPEAALLALAAALTDQGRGS